MKYYRATQTLTGEHADDHTHYTIAQGTVLPEGHKIVQHDLKHGNVNFAPLDDGEEEQLTASPRGRAASKAKP